MDAVSKSRAVYLRVDQVRRLHHWCASITVMFQGEVPYLVGSALSTHNWRDVDIRLMLDDEAFDALRVTVNLDDLNMIVSQWGIRDTELPIDFQVQRTSDANAEFPGRRHAMGQMILALRGG